MSGILVKEHADFRIENLLRVTGAEEPEGTPGGPDAAFADFFTGFNVATL
jgi:hypothetical protein